MKKRGLALTLTLLLTACTTDMTNVVNRVNVTKGTSTCPQQVTVTTVRNEIYYYETGWFESCAESPEGLNGLAVEEWNDDDGTEYWLHRPNDEWVQVYWWKYTE